MLPAEAAMDAAWARIDASWHRALDPVFDSAPVIAARRSVVATEAAGTMVFPPAEERFRALELVPLPTVRVVVLGQDPYHRAGQAHGLSFSVAPGVPAPPSLKNIYRELADDLGHPPAAHGHLDAWARQGVLLLNDVLTVEAGRAASHRGRGWEVLTDAIVRAVADRAEPSVFLLWGAPAQKKAAFVQGTRHLVLAAPHPSPLAAYRGWFGSRPFSQANAFLAANGRGTVGWSLA